MRGQLIIALFHGTTITIVLLIFRVPLAAALGVLIFIGSFIPLVGLVVTGALAVAVALLEHGTTAAIAVAVAIVVLVQVEGHVLQPFILSRSVDIHPLAVVLSVIAGTTLRGIPGAAHRRPAGRVSQYQLPLTPTRPGCIIRPEVARILQSLWLNSAMAIPSIAHATTESDRVKSVRRQPDSSLGGRLRSCFDDLQRSRWGAKWRRKPALRAPSSASGPASHWPPPGCCSPRAEAHRRARPPARRRHGVDGTVGRRRRRRRAPAPVGRRRPRRRVVLRQGAQSRDGRRIRGEPS